MHNGVSFEMCSRGNLIWRVVVKLHWKMVFTSAKWPQHVNLTEHTCVYTNTHILQAGTALCNCERLRAGPVTPSMQQGSWAAESPAPSPWLMEELLNTATATLPIHPPPCPALQAQANNKHSPHGPGVQGGIPPHLVSPDPVRHSRGESLHYTKERVHRMLEVTPGSSVSTSRPSSMTSSDSR